MLSSIKAKIGAFLLGLVGILAVIANYYKGKAKRLQYKVRSQEVKEDINKKVTEAMVKGSERRTKIREKYDELESNDKPVKRTDIK